MSAEIAKKQLLEGMYKIVPSLRYHFIGDNRLLIELDRIYAKIEKLQPDLIFDVTHRILKYFDTYQEAPTNDFIILSAAYANWFEQHDRDYFNPRGKDYNARMQEVEDLMLKGRNSYSMY